MMVTGAEHQEELGAALAQLGAQETSTYHKMPLFGHFFVTDAVRFLAERGGCWWLMDVIGSYSPRLRRSGAERAYATLVHDGEMGATFVLDNGLTGHERVEYARQQIEWADFPWTALGVSEFRLDVHEGLTLDHQSRPVPGYYVQLPKEP